MTSQRHTHRIGNESHKGIDPTVSVNRNVTVPNADTPVLPPPSIHQPTPNRTDQTPLDVRLGTVVGNPVCQ
jgi:hypothetical protein